MVCQANIKEISETAIVLTEEYPKVIKGKGKVFMGLPTYLILDGDRLYGYYYGNMDLSAGRIIAEKYIEINYKP